MASVIAVVVAEETAASGLSFSCSAAEDAEAAVHLALAVVVAATTAAAANYLP